MTMYKMRLASTLLVVLAGISCQPKQPEQEPQRVAPPIPVDQALSYEVVQREDTSSRSRKRMSAFIYSPAQSVEARIQTSMKAAFDLQQSTGCDFVKVFHLISPDPNQVGTGTYYADLSYAPDGRGVDGESPLRNGAWEATVSDEVVDSLTLEAEKLWWSNRSKFQRADGFGGTETDEKAMKEFIAKQLKVKPEAVHLAILTRRQYP
jgi:hypothetical protein